MIPQIIQGRRSSFNTVGAIPAAGQQAVLHEECLHRLLDSLCAHSSHAFHTTLLHRDTVFVHAVFVQFLYCFCTVFGTIFVQCLYRIFTVSVRFLYSFCITIVIVQIPFCFRFSRSAERRGSVESRYEWQSPNAEKYLELLMHEVGIPGTDI